MGLHHQPFLCLLQWPSVSYRGAAGGSELTDRSWYLKWIEKEPGVLILSHVLSVGFFSIDDTKSQPFAAIIEANKMFLKAIQDVATLLGLLRQ